MARLSRTAVTEGAELWRPRVEGLAASGKSCKEYAAEIGVNPHTLAGWRWKLRGSTASRPSTTPPARCTCSPRRGRGSVIPSQTGRQEARLRDPHQSPD